MTRKVPSKKAAKLRKPKLVAGYIAVREMASENKSYTEPDRVFASKGAAQKYAAQLNRELRALTNPFADDREPDQLMTGGEPALGAVLKKLGVPVPQRQKGRRTSTGRSGGTRITTI